MRGPRALALPPLLLLLAVAACMHAVSSEDVLQLPRAPLHRDEAIRVTTLSEGPTRKNATHMLLVGTLSGDMFAVDAEKGTVLWKVDMQGPLLSTSRTAPAAPGAEGAARSLAPLFIPSLDGSLFAFQPGEGLKRMPHTAAEMVSATPRMVGESSLLLGSKRTMIMALDPLTGDVLREFRMGAQGELHTVSHSPATAAGNSGAGTGTGTGTGTGKEEEVVVEDEGEVCFSALPEGTLFVGRLDHIVRALDTTSMEEMYKLAVGEFLSLGGGGGGSAAAARVAEEEGEEEEEGGDVPHAAGVGAAPGDNSTLVSTLDGTLFFLRNDEPVWELALESPAVSVFSVGRDGKISAQLDLTRKLDFTCTSGMCYGTAADDDGGGGGGDGRAAGGPEEGGEGRSFVPSIYVATSPNGQLYAVPNRLQSQMHEHMPASATPAHVLAIPYHFSALTEFLPAPPSDDASADSSELMRRSGNSILGFMEMCEAEDEFASCVAGFHFVDDEPDADDADPDPDAHSDKGKPEEAGEEEEGEGEGPLPGPPPPFQVVLQVNQWSGVVFAVVLALLLQCTGRVQAALMRVLKGTPLASTPPTTTTTTSSTPSTPSTASATPTTTTSSTTTTSTTSATPPAALRVSTTAPRTPTSSSHASTPPPPTRVGKLELHDHVLGYGSHGTIVYEGTYDGRPVAVKRMLADFVTLASTEIGMLIHSDEHPNVLRYFAQEDDAEFVYLALERCDQSLAQCVESTAFHALDESGYPHAATLALLRDVVRGVAHLHSVNVVHRDIKPHNVLLKGGRAKISDMGLSRRLEGGQSSFVTSRAVGSVGWQPPEVLDAAHGRQTRRVDTFSLGCLLYYVLTGGGHPFGANRLSRDHRIMQGAVDLGRLAHLPDACDLIAAMVHREPEARPDVADVLAHPFFWSDARTLAFLATASDRVKVERDREKKRFRGVEQRYCSLIVHALEGGADLVVGSGGWIERVDGSLLGDLRDRRTYNAASVVDLLRAIRNKRIHYGEMRPYLQALTGPLPDAREGAAAPPHNFLRYFATRFPALKMHVYRAMRRYCAHEVDLQQFVG